MSIYDQIIIFLVVLAILIWTANYYFSARKKKKRSGDEIEVLNKSDELAAGEKKEIEVEADETKATVVKTTPVAVVRRTSWSWLWWIAAIVLLLIVIGYIAQAWRAPGPIQPQSTGRIADSLILPPGEGKIDVRFTISSAELDSDVLSMYLDPNQGWQQIRLFINGHQDPSWQWHALTGKGVARYRGIKKFLRVGENVLTIEYRLEKQPVILRDLYLDK